MKGVIHTCGQADCAGYNKESLTVVQVENRKIYVVCTICKQVYGVIDVKDYLRGIRKNREMFDDIPEEIEIVSEPFNV